MENKFQETKIEGRNAVLEAFVRENPWTNFLCWKNVRTVLSVPF